MRAKRDGNIGNGNERKRTTQLETKGGVKFCTRENCDNISQLQWAH